MHVWLAARLALRQVPLLLKCGPLTATPVMPRRPPPPLLTVTAWGELLVPICWEPNVKAAGLIVAAGMFVVAVPASEIVTLPPELLEAIVRLLERAPAAPGAKVKTIVQFPPFAASVMPP